MSTSALPTSLATNAPRSALEKLQRKIQHNLGLGVVAFARKGVRFATSEVKSHAVFHSAVELGVGVRIDGRTPSIHNPGGTLIIGDDVVFAAPVTAIYIDLKPGAALSIGDSTYLNDGVWLGCTERISIGKRVLVGPGVRCIDNSYHGVYQRRVMPPAKPITIEDDAWIASDAIILPGVTIGRGAIVAAHAVVLNDVAPFTVVAGNPAKEIKKLDPARFDEDH